MKKLFTVLPLVLATSAAMHMNRTKPINYHIVTLMIRTDIFWPNAKGEYGFPAHKTIVNRVKAEVSKRWLTHFIKCR